MFGMHRSSVPRRAACAAASAAIALSSGSALAVAGASPSIARLTNVAGTVLVDRGLGFARVTDDTGLRVGDRVMVTDGGGAFLSFSETCAFPLEAPSMTTVAETACSLGTQNGGTGTVGPVVLGLGFLGIGGFVLYNVLNDDDDDDGQPVSP
jgi:hypothetical protein